MRYARRILAISILAISAPMVLAFKPRLENGHDAITLEGLSSIARTVGGRTISFAPFAILEVLDANIETDSVFLFNFFSPELHFDNEEFAKASGNLKTYKELGIQFLLASPPNGTEARRTLGRALHLVQDFYAHSTWVETGRTLPFSALGRSTFDGPGNVKTCEADRSTVATGFTLLTSGYFDLTPSGLLCVAPAIPNNKCAHGLPTCTIAGIHKDKAETGRPFLTARSIALEATRDYVNQILDDPRIASNSAALHAFFGVKPGGNPAGGSTLGMVIDDTGSMGDEIAQVKALVQQIVAGVAGTPGEPAEYLLVRFGDPDVGPAFRTNNSASFLTQVAALTTGGGGDCPELPMNALLQALAASQAGATLFLVTDDQAKDAALAGSVISAAQNKKAQIVFVISTGGCGGSVDPVYYQIAQATGGQVYSVPAAQISMLAPHLKGAISGSQAPLLRASGILTSSAAYAGPSGTPFYVPEPSSPEPLGAPQGETTLLRPGARTIRIEGAEGEYAVTPFESQPVIGPLQFSIPVDASLQKLTISVTVAAIGPAFLFRPSGTSVTGGQPGVTVTALSNGFIVELANPEVGIWTLRISGLGIFFVSAWAESSLHLGDVVFVALQGRAGHEGLMPIAGMPTGAAPQTIAVRLLETANLSELTFVSETGTALGPPAPITVDPLTRLGTATVTLPTVPFRMVIAGTTGGSTFLRSDTALYRRQTVEVNPVSAPEFLMPATTSRLTFRVRNHGPRDSFRVALTDNLGATLTAPATITLDPGASTDVSFDVLVPSGVPALTTISFHAGATSVADPSATNGATVLLNVVLPHPLPVLSSGTPPNVMAGGPDLNLAMRGAGFVTGSLVMWNGVGRSTSFVSSSELAATIPAADLATAGAAQVTVFNPTPGGGTSNPLTVAVIDFSLGATPSSATVRAGQSVSYTINITPQGGLSFPNPVSSFQCSGLPALATCTFSPAAVTPGASPATVTLAISTTAAGVAPAASDRQPFLPPMPLVSLWLLLFAFLAARALARKKYGRVRFAPAAALLAVAVFQLSCGGGSSSAPPPPAPRPGTPPGNYTIAVSASSGGASRSTNVMLAVQ
jgi:hypothetical protein